MLVAYSGGADSTCLLHLCSELGLDTIAAHLHHGQRDEAEDEMRRCGSFAESLGVPFVSGRADVPGLATELKIGLEEAGRRARYEFLRASAFRTGCDLIATAHTRDDHIETVLFNLARGTGLAGLAGIPTRNENVVRPMLIFGREETRRYCEERGLWFHDDPANEDLAFSRARLRRRVMPEFRCLNPSFDQAIERMTGIVGAESQYLDAIAAAALEACEVPLNGPLRFLTEDVEVAFDRGRLASLHEVPLRRGLRLTMGALGRSLDYDQVLDLIHGMRSGGRGSLTAEGGDVVVEWNDERVHFRILVSEETYRQPLVYPGETTEETVGWTLVAEPWPVADYRRERGALEAVVDRAGIKGQLYCRSWSQGDELQPLGMGGHRKISDILGEMKLTEAARRRLPLVCDLIGPIWIPGGPLAARVAIVPSSINAVRISFGSARRPPVP